MAVIDLERATYCDVEAAMGANNVALLPIGAVEAHGPHLPLTTDVTISQAMANSGAHKLSNAGWTTLILPAIRYTAAPFAAGFPGTISVGAATVTQLIVDIARSIHSFGVGHIVMVNSHLDPANLAALTDAVMRIEQEVGMTVCFPNLVKRPWVLRMSDEFKSGACHAGQYETSVLLAARPEDVRSEQARVLPENNRSLSVAIRDGKTRFEESGGPEAYFGAPARATAAEGIQTIETLGQILYDSFVECLT